VLLVHQEGVLALLAVIGLAFSERGILPALSPEGPMIVAVAAGAAAGLACVAVLWLLRHLGPLKRLESWQRVMVSEWSDGDAVAVALISGLAEEAMLRAFLQPVIGLFPAAVLFAVLHLVPDRKLWFWPFFALISGLMLGGLYELYGFPAAAAAHIVMNGAALLRLRRPERE
jgi:membrane protease YdiL (CAAX protease family)